MKEVKYRLSSLIETKYGNYIVQRVCDRKLTDIYHSHDFYELTAVINGSCTMIFNEKSCHLTKNFFVLMRPDDRHKFISQSDDMIILSLSVSASEFEKICSFYEPSIINLLQNYDGIPLFECQDVSTLQISFWDSTHDEKNEYEYKFLLTGFIKELADIKNKKSESLPRNLSFAIKEIKKPENLKVGIPAFVALSNYSRPQLSRLIHKHFGVTLHSYITSLRLEAAKSEIILSREPLESISEHLGYASFSHFNKIFKEKYKITPAALRKSKSLWTT